MKLLVLAQTPPPLHGQSVMVRAAVEGLPRHGIAVTHVNLRLSRTAADIGGWRPGKILAILDACFHAIVARFTEGCDTLYYVPAPAKRGALYRDWLVLALCRPFFHRLVLHFHNGGLGEWIETQLTAPERAVTQALLGRADLAIVLTDSLRTDAEALAARRIVAVSNGVAFDGTAIRRNRNPSDRFRILFLGSCCEEKGLFDLIEATHDLNARSGSCEFEVIVAGAFPDTTEAERFRKAAEISAGEVNHLGFARGEALERLWAQVDCLCLPTYYPHEGQPLVILESLARDIPVVASDWRGIRATLQGSHSIVVPPRNREALTAALLDLRTQPIPIGAGRRCFDARYRMETHLEALAQALRPLEF